MVVGTKVSPLMFHHSAIRGVRIGLAISFVKFTFLM